MREIVKVALRLLVIMLVAGLCLGGTYVVTKDPIAAQQQAQRDAARKAVLPDADRFEEVALENSGNITECYKGIASDGSQVGYAFSVTAKGFGGSMALTVGVADGKVSGVRIGGHAETPGLGAKAGDEAFYGQFTGKSGELSVLKNGTPGEHQISAITAATVTSDAVTQAVNQVLDYAGNLE